MQRLMMLRMICLVPMVGVLGCEPVGPIAGGALQGQATEVPDAWDEAREIKTFQMETRADDPYSVNLWGVVVDDGLYVASGEGGGATWVEYLADDPEVRLRMSGKLFELRAVRVDEAQEMQAVRLRYIEKYDIEDDPGMDGEFGEEAWVFRLDPR
jgi:hypothetical protein